MKRILATVLLTLASAGALADNDSGLYLGIGAGQFNIELDEVDGETFDSDDTTYKLFAGYRINRFFGVEFDYIDLGSPSDTVDGFNFETKIKGFAPYAIGTLPLGPIELFARVGYYFYDFEVDGPAGGATLDDSDEDLVYGVGVGLTIFDHLHARLEYEEFDVTDTQSANAIWLSGAWRF